jgi:hypothetical protein
MEILAEEADRCILPWGREARTELPAYGLFLRKDLR